MKKNLLIVALVAAAAAVIIFQQKQIARLQAAAPAKDVAVSVAPAPAPAKKPASPAKRAEPEVGRVASRPESAKPGPVPATTAESPKPGLADMMKGIGSMMTNAAMKEMIRQQSKFQLEREYARLFKFLNLTPEQTEALHGILMDRQMALMDSGLSFLGGDVPPAEREAKARDMKELQESYDKKIAALLSPEDYDAFQQYEDSAPERQQVEMVKSSLASAGEPLTEQQEYDLVNAMLAARANVPGGAAMFDRDEMPGPGTFSGSGLTNMLARMDQVNAAYAASAAKILTPTQNEQYLKMLEQQRAMNAMGLQMAAQMFGGSSNGAPVQGSVQVRVLSP